MVTTLIKTVTLTYIIIDIHIIILGINITSKYIFSTTLRTHMACATTSVFF